MSDEIIDEKSTSTEVEKELEQTPEQSSQGESDIPQKFVGKSAIDVIQAYKELEKDRGRLAQQLGDSRKDKEGLEARYRQSENERMVAQSEVRSPKQVTLQDDEDPISAFDSTFEADPRGAIREAIKSVSGGFQKRDQKEALRDATSYYQQQKQNNPDYARREPIMQQLAQELKDIIKPEHLASVKMLQALDVMSRGFDIEHYSKQAVERSQKEGLSVKNEKRHAQSESASSQGDSSVKFSALSLADMEKALGRSDD